MKWYERSSLPSLPRVSSSSRTSDNLSESYLLTPTQELHFDEVEGINRTALTAEDYEPSAKAYHTTTAIFFAGIVVTWFLDRIIRSLFACQGYVSDINGM